MALDDGDAASRRRLSPRRGARRCHHRAAAGRVARRGAATAALVCRCAGARARSELARRARRAHRNAGLGRARRARPAAAARQDGARALVEFHRTVFCAPRTALSRCRSPAWVAPTGATPYSAPTMADEAMAVACGEWTVRRSAAARRGGPLVRRLRGAAVRAAARRAPGRHVHARHAVDVARAAASPQPARPAAGDRTAPDQALRESGCRAGALSVRA